MTKQDSQEANHMNNLTGTNEKWLRAHLPKELADEPIDYFSGEYLVGLTVMGKGERGGPDTVVFEAKDEEELRYWMLETICHFIKEKDPPARKIWRYYRDHARDGQWFYIERRHYDYNAIDDPRLYGFERFLRNLKAGFPPALWEDRVRRCVGLMNRWYKKAHWDYDRNALCFVEVSDSKEYAADNDDTEEPRPGSVIRIID